MSKNSATVRAVYNLIQKYNAVLVGDSGLTEAWRTLLANNGVPDNPTTGQKRTLRNLKIQEDMLRAILSVRIPEEWRNEE